jgi:DNA-directed RNA polymerase
MQIIDLSRPTEGVIPDKAEQRSVLEQMMDRQAEIEQYAVNWGIDRFNTKLENAAKQDGSASVGAAVKLMQMAVEPTIKAIDAFVTDQLTGRKERGEGGAKHCSLRFIEMLGHREVAYLTVKVILDSITKVVQLRTAAGEITKLIMDELKFRRFREQSPGLYKYKMAKFTTSNYAHMARSLDATIKYHNENSDGSDTIDTSDLEVTDRQKFLIGIKLIDLCMLSTGMFTIERDNKVTGKNAVKTELTIKATQETLDFLTDRNGVLESLFPVFLPMVVPPLPWAPGKMGGYRFNLRGKHPLVRGISRAHEVRLSQAEMPKVYSALNRIQGTPWVINTKVCDLLVQLETAGGDMAGVPKVDKYEDVPKPDDIDTNEAARKEWRKKQHAVHEKNHQRKLDRVSFLRFMSIVKLLRNEVALWFPHNIDFRGRVYPVTNFLSPQGDDMSKAVLKFAQGKPLGRTGGAWLAMHGANCLGTTPDKVKLSKQTLPNRIKWIQEHTTEIEECAKNPLAVKWWMDADDPLQFIAFCFDWAEFMVLHRQDRGHEYVSSLACAMDGTCNGLQHYSAMLLDPVGAKAVNVLPSETPQDIYQSVMDVGLVRIEADLGDPNVGLLSGMWLKSKLCDRKLAKPPVMTFPYGSKQFGFRQQLIDNLLARKNYHEFKHVFETTETIKAPSVEKEADESEGKGMPVDSEDGETVTEATEQKADELHNVMPQACGYMAKVMWESLGDVVVAAQQAMSWMQKCARLIAKHGRCVEWRVPGTGYWVSQEYVREEKGTIRTVLAGEMLQCSVYKKTTEPNAAKQASAIAPNIVHSLDAAALMMTVDMAQAQGIENFHMVHDSYGVLAADCELMADTLRRAFYNLYSSNDVIKSLYSQFLDLMPAEHMEDLPVPPKKGNLDLAQVLNSPYFFC